MSRQYIPNYSEPVGDEYYKVKYKIKVSNIGKYPLYKIVLPPSAYINLIDWFEYLSGLGEKKIKKVCEIVFNRQWWDACGRKNDLPQVQNYAAKAILNYVKKVGVEL